MEPPLEVGGHGLDHYVRVICSPLPPWARAAGEGGDATTVFKGAAVVLWRGAEVREGARDGNLDAEAGWWRMED